jgi:hypothetical protein
VSSFTVLFILASRIRLLLSPFRLLTLHPLQWVEAFVSPLQNQAMQESRASKLLFKRKLRAGPYQGVYANYKLPRAASLDLIRSLFSGIMQLIEVIRRGFWVISSFHSAAEGLGPLARNAESSNGGSLDVLLELSLCFFISEPSLITSYQRSATRIQLVGSLALWRRRNVGWSPVSLELVQHGYFTSSLSHCWMRCLDAMQPSSPTSFAHLEGIISRQST